MGKSIAQFVVPGWTPEQVLGFATTFAGENRMRVENSGPNHVLLATGSIWWAGKRSLMVLASDGPGGTTVRVEVWIEGLVTLNANPNEFVGMIPRRAAWRLASAFVSRFGLVPESVFGHY